MVSKGQSAVEYIVPTVIVILTSGLILSGVGLNGSLFNMVRGNTAATLQNKTLVVKAFGMPMDSSDSTKPPDDGDDPPSYIISNHPYTSTLLYLKNGQTVEIGFQPPEEVVEAAGGHGLTNSLAERLMQVAMLLEENGEISAEDSNAMTDLAKSAQQIASIQASIEAVAPKDFSDPNAVENFLTSYITMPDNTQASVASAIYAIQYANKSPDWGMADLPETIAPGDVGGLMKGSYMGDFLRKYQAVQDSGAMDNELVSYVLENDFAPGVIRSSLSTNEHDNQAFIDILKKITQDKGDGICALGGYHESCHHHG